MTYKIFIDKKSNQYFQSSNNLSTLLSQ